MKIDLTIDGKKTGEKIFHVVAVTIWNYNGKNHTYTIHSASVSYIRMGVGKQTLLKYQAEPFLREK